jgi:hypothetical protein
MRSCMTIVEEPGNRLALLRVALVIRRQPRPTRFEDEVVGAQQGHRAFDVPAPMRAPTPWSHHWAMPPTVSLAAGCISR